MVFVLTYSAPEGASGRHALPEQKVRVCISRLGVRRPEEVNGLTRGGACVAPVDYMPRLRNGSMVVAS